jgi:hypothetical protein
MFSDVDPFKKPIDPENKSIYCHPLHLIFMSFSNNLIMNITFFAVSLVSKTFPPHKWTKAHHKNLNIGSSCLINHKNFRKTAPGKTRRKHLL